MKIAFVVTKLGAKHGKKGIKNLGSYRKKLTK
jgi:hypothetical protein